MGTRSPLFVRKQPGGMFSVIDQNLTTGDIWFVHSGTGTDGSGYGYNPDSPLASVGYCLSQDKPTASKGDIIYCMPGHAETLSAATSLVMDIAGVKVIGLGWGSLRPTFTITTADTALWSITAANCWVENVLIVSNFLNIASAMSVGASADGLVLKHLEFRDTSVILGALIQLLVAANCDDVTIDNCVFRQLALTAAATNIIKFAGGCDRLRLTNSYFEGACTAAVVEASTAASTDVFLDNVAVLNTDTTAGLAIAFHNSSTGWVNNVHAVNLKNGVKGVTGTGLSIGPNVNYSNAVNAYAGLFSYTVDA